MAECDLRRDTLYIEGGDLPEKPVMIFHVAYRLNPEAKSASGIRPVKMRRAFEEIGYRVIEISGRHPERREQIKRVREQIERGLHVDFVYSESATAPTGLGEPVTPATSLSRDIRFLQFCRRSGIPVGLFYRDIYWNFPIYSQLVRWPLSAILRTLHRRDLRAYRRAGIDIYLPSMEMSKWVPIIDRARFRELPPGCEVRDTAPSESDGEASTAALRLLYVGGLNDNYRMHQSVRAIAGRPGVELTICTREAEWKQREPEYRELMAPNIRVVHRSGDELHELYDEANACLLAVEPIVYWTFAVPVKLFEYLGNGKPVIASSGSYSGRFVRDQSVGWTVGYGDDEFGETLDRLVARPEELEAVTEWVREVRHRHTWVARAQQVVTDLAR
ncbi:glycosyltransferase [Leucobacter sp. USCH14]|uniref:glycosyltransferase family protein n=1 Tax=Leucobacter sp. USCH14 TaxID=3024838 RepID=UPI0030AEB231